MRLFSDLGTPYGFRYEYSSSSCDVKNNGFFKAHEWMVWSYLPSRYCLFSNAMANIYNVLGYQ